ncbi:MAG: hypothetical protein H6500_01820 [Candidatus Woesearchaeota archaeon]|nr:MAG: hypothetical protein H6500_01820 [Candidatus Woesearchaeota archaeon]
MALVHEAEVGTLFSSLLEEREIVDFLDVLKQENFSFYKDSLFHCVQMLDLCTDLHLTKEESLSFARASLFFLRETLGISKHSLRTGSLFYSAAFANNF